MKNILLLLAFAGLSGFVAIVCFTLYLPDWPTRGQFGDSFGSLNAIFSGMAFAGLIYTVILQRHELAMQREQLSLQRDEMKLSRVEMEAQTKIQRASFHAQQASIRVAGIQAQIDAVKVISSGATVGRDFSSQGEKVGALASLIDAQAAALAKQAV